MPGALSKAILLLWAFVAVNRCHLIDVAFPWGGLSVLLRALLNSRVLLCHSMTIFSIICKPLAILMRFGPCDAILGEAFHHRGLKWSNVVSLS